MNQKSKSFKCHASVQREIGLRLHGQASANMRKIQQGVPTHEHVYPCNTGNLHQESMLRELYI
jgi:hypothetical protein